MGDKQEPVTTPTKACVKTEDPRRSATGIDRLPSFRMPRDLTLGGSNTSRRGGLALNSQAKGKRNFTPNLNVQRSKPKEEAKVKEEPTRKEKNASRGHSGRGRGDRGRGRNIIQQAGVFSEGIGAEEFRANRLKYGDGGGGGGGGGGGEAIMMKPKVDFKATLKADVKEEEARLKLLLRDDFIDDPEADGPRVVPIELPVSAKTHVKTVKKEVTREDECRNGITTSSVRIKQEPVDEDSNINETSYNTNASLGEAQERMIDILSQTDSEFIVVQLPACLPGLRPSSEPDNPKGQAHSNAAKPQQREQLPQQQCTLSTLTDSQIGKIELLRSGAARLRIGEITFPLSLGTQSSFKQDVVAVELDDSTKTGNMMNLGSIKNRLVAPPDWDTLLCQSSGDALQYQMPKS